MDKIAIISDIHGNITALNAVLEDIKNRKINKILFRRLYYKMHSSRFSNR